jgi:magnesium transporter
VRGEEADYLAYAVMDAVVDHFFPMLETLGEEIEGLEERVVENPGMEIIREIHSLKRKTTAFRRAVWPLRGVFNKLLTGEGSRFQESTRIYLRDVSDHVFGVLDMLESQRELSSGLLEVYLSSNGNRMNEIMKVLTMIATMFIPLSFIAGLYGMNFKTEISPLNMPELGWYWGYPFVLGLMATVAGGLMWFFKKKGWWGRARPAEGERAES